MGRRRVRPIFDAVIEGELLARVDFTERVKIDAFGTAVWRGRSRRRHEIPVLRVIYEARRVRAALCVQIEAIAVSRWLSYLEEIVAARSAVVPGLHLSLSDALAVVGAHQRAG